METRTSRARVRWAATALVVVAAGGRCAIAQPEEAPEPPPTPREVLGKAQAYYRTRATCERVNIEVRPQGDTARSWFVARIDPTARVAAPGATAPADGDRGAQGPDPVVALELRSLRLFAAGGEVTVVHERNPGTFYRAEHRRPLTPRSLAGVVPPVPLPQLDLALTPEGETCEGFWPYATGVTWTAARVDPRRRARHTLEGAFAGGEVTLTLDGERLQDIEIRDTARATVIRMAFLPLGPCDPAASVIETEGRSRVAALGDLRPKAGVLAVGATVPQMPMTNAGGQQARTADLLDPPDEFLPAERARRLVLVFTPDERAGAAERGGPGVEAGGPGKSRFDWDALANGLREMRAGAYGAKKSATLPGDAASLLPPFTYARVLVMDAPRPDEIMARLADEREKWGRDLLWTTVAASTTGLFTHGARPVVIVVDEASRLRAVQIVEDGTTPEALLDQIAVALIEEGEDIGQE